MSNDPEITEDARTLMRLIFDRQAEGASTSDNDLRNELGWKAGRYGDARAELSDMDKIQLIFLPLNIIAQMADAFTTIAREIMRDGRRTTLWDNQTEPYRAWLLTQVSNVISNRWATPKDLHENRRLVLIADGWRYGDKFDEKEKISDELRPWEEMPHWYKMSYLIFVSTVRTLAREPK